METNRRILKMIVILVIVGCMSHCGFYVGKYIQAKKVYTELMQNCTTETEGRVLGSESYVKRYRRSAVSTRYKKIHTKKWYVVDYEYDVNGKKYQGEFTARLNFAKDSTLTVHYDPSDPSASYAENQPYPYHHDYIRMMCTGPVLMCAVISVVIRRNSDRE